MIFQNSEFFGFHLVERSFPRTAGYSYIKKIKKTGIHGLTPVDILNCSFLHNMSYAVQKLIGVKRLGYIIINAQFQAFFDLRFLC
jgi:hypothetical protein